MRVENEKIVYESNDERLMAVAAVIREVFPENHAFVLVSYDFAREPTPSVIDNYQNSADAMALLKSILDYYHDASVKTYNVTPDGQFKSAEPRAPVEKEQQ